MYFWISKQTMYKIKQEHVKFHYQKISLHQLFYWKFQTSTVMYSNCTNSTLNISNHAGIWFTNPTRPSNLSPGKKGEQVQQAVWCSWQGKPQLRRKRNKRFSSRENMYNLRGKIHGGWKSQDCIDVQRFQQRGGHLFDQHLLTAALPIPPFLD